MVGAERLKLKKDGVMKGRRQCWGAGGLTKTAAA